MPVRFVPHDPRWRAFATAEGERVRRAAGGAIGLVHHVGSTAVPGIVAKPVIDLLGVASDLPALDAAQGALEALGYE